MVGAIAHCIRTLSCSWPIWVRFLIPHMIPKHCWEWHPRAELGVTPKHQVGDWKPTREVLDVAHGGKRWYPTWCRNLQKGLGLERMTHQMTKYLVNSFRWVVLETLRSSLSPSILDLSWQTHSPPWSPGKVECWTCHLRCPELQMRATHPKLRMWQLTAFGKLGRRAPLFCKGWKGCSPPPSFFSPVILPTHSPVRTIVSPVNSCNFPTASGYSS